MLSQSTFIQPPGSLRIFFFNGIVRKKEKVKELDMKKKISLP